MLRRRDEIFPVKLNDDQRYGICLRIALGWTTRQVQAWLRGQRVEISYAGLRRYWRRKRWVRLTEALRASITSRPEARELIRAAVCGWLDTESDGFKKLGENFKDDLRRMSIQDPQRIDRYQNAGFFLVQRFNEVLNRVAQMTKALGLTKGSM